MSIIMKMRVAQTSSAIWVAMLQEVSIKNSLTPPVSTAVFDHLPYQGRQGFYMKLSGNSCAKSLN